MRSYWSRVGPHIKKGNSDSDTYAAGDAMWRWRGRPYKPRKAKDDRQSRRSYGTGMEWVPPHSSQKNQPCWHLHRRLPASRTFGWSRPVCGTLLQRLHQTRLGLLLWSSRARPSSFFKTPLKSSASSSDSQAWLCGALGYPVRLCRGGRGRGGGWGWGRGSQVGRTGAPTLFQTGSLLYPLKTQVPTRTETIGVSLSWRELVRNRVCELFMSSWSLSHYELLEREPVCYISATRDSSRTIQQKYTRSHMHNLECSASHNKNT